MTVRNNLTVYKGIDIYMVIHRTRRKESIFSRMLRIFVFAALLIFIFSLIGNIFMKKFDLYINVSTSLPIGLYKAHVPEEQYSIPFTKKYKDIVLHKNDLVLVCLNPKLAEWADNRGYIFKGRCPGGFAPIGKRVAALAGDTVRFSKEGIYVNNILIPDSEPEEKDSQGRVLPSYKGEITLALHEVVLVNPKKDSFDSRYFGPININDIYATIRPILTM